MRPLEKLLEKLAEFQYNNYKMLLLFVLFFTIFMLVGVTKVSFQSDMSESNPKDLDIYKLNDKITEKFGGQDTILVLITLDDTYDFKDLPKDIRNPDIIKYITNFQNSLSKESSISSVTSVGTYFSSFENIDEDAVRYVLTNFPVANRFFSDDFDATYIIVNSDIGGGKKKVDEITNLVNNKLLSFSQPPGTKYSITGSPPIEITITGLLISDAKYTILLACIFIFIFLLIFEGNFIRSVLVFTPLILGLLWTIGTLGWLGIQISMATAGLGAMLLGLGVEYGVFMLKRYEEERHKGNNQKDSLKVSVPGVGSAIVGSGLTTTIGFSALTLSVLPMLQDLGKSLAIGIIFCLLSAIFVSPLIFIVFERLFSWIDHKLYHVFKKHVEKKEYEDLI